MPKQTLRQAQGAEQRRSIKIAIVGVGNCCSSLIQGLFYYKKIKQGVPGLMHPEINGYKISEIRPVAAFDIDGRKVGKDLSKAIFAPPNCTKVFYSRIPNLGVKVKMGQVLDGVASHLKDYPEEKRFVVSKEKPANAAEELKKSGAEILINYLPVGSQKAVEFYAKAALEAGCAFINCMPVFIASDKKWAEKFKKKGLPVIGDDVKSQVGATIIHRVLSRLFSERGVKIDKSYQLNFGGNTDFLNMLERARLKSKKISKTESVESQLKNRLSYDDLHVGPSDYIPWLKDNKICFIRIEGRKFGNIPVELELKLSVEDSPNSAGCVIDAIRLAKLALNKKIGGPIISASAYLMKHPPVQFSDEKAREMVEEFITGTSQH
ncbi:MAG: inositol-3-phosphate synthase [Parcubacteria group bacterium CG1_02_39_15]|uniref:Inositol-3-phosphate synthase n=3 Tax=Candidatus Nealsoniibacteriota TaxID=1817911 RepID=A0A2G9YTK3_9BACT|nr:MAG: inositol-3-phosphate synthase [Parcubacteria group bacterium CG1_02_39_15]PIP22502.1 MAG: inositol-3-phosphate synthase [Candidatus Nealsonbacteria bacterium CG23_combo_of_CG06-09_8_20_14_all_39_25]PIW89993.1 MAG: inositol-3-phosphate synthase [Candidatus Nealsonbacteria bacterium CG_4_8_14_3_um_filter_40_11]PIZ87872.1 MAG: inositol-3-phosphate synthase [Candidatus Nealsonbacteria bacterium CG_4_10_14_0_2_um_filter_39_15]